MGSTARPFPETRRHDASIGELVQGYFDYVRSLPTVFWFGLLLGCLVAFGFNAFNLTLAGDDWTQLFNGNSQDEWILQIGRWTERIVWEVFDDNRFAPTFSLFLMLGCLIFSHLLMSYALRLPAIEAFLFTSISLFFPAWAEVVNFKTNHITVGFGWLFATLFGILAFQVANRAGYRSLWPAASLSVAFGALAAGSYQTLLFVGVLAFMLLLLDGLVKDPQSFRALRVLGTLLRFAALAVLVLALYSVITAIVLKANGLDAVRHGNYSLDLSTVTLQGIFKNGATIFQRLKELLFQPQHLYPQFAKVLQLMFLAGLFLGLVVTALRSAGSRWSYLLFCFLGIGILLLAPFAIYLIKGTNATLRYNAIVPLSYTFAGFYVLSVGSLRWKAARSTISISAIVLVTIFLFHLNVAGMTTYLNNTRDLFVAARIVDRIEGLPDFPLKGPVPLVIVGSMPEPAGLPFNTARAPAGTFWKSSIVECGVFDCQVQRFVYAVRFSSPNGVSFAVRKYDENLKSVRDHEINDAFRSAVHSADPWPAPTSVQMIDGIVLLKLR